MAALATVAAALGRPQPGMRLLGLAVAGLVLVDPLLVESVGFGLSVAASAGILLLSGRIAGALSGAAPARRGAGRHARRPGRGDAAAARHVRLRAGRDGARQPPGRPRRRSADDVGR